MTTDPMKWLQEIRGLDPDLLASMGVRPFSGRGIEGPGVAFPYRRGGETYAGKARGIAKHRANGSANFTSTSGVSRGLYNEDELHGREILPIVITEGEIDCLSVMQAGWDRAVSVPDGWTADNGKERVLWDAADLLRRSPYVVVAGDADEVGSGLPWAVARVLRGHDVRRAVWPDGCKDANDVLVQHGEGALSACLQAAVSVDPKGGQITGLSDLPPLPERRVLRINERPFNAVVAMELGALSVWTGVPGSGKSTFLLWAANRVTDEENVRVGIMAFETHAHDIRDQLAMNRAGKAWADLDQSAREQLAAIIDKRFRFVHVRLEDGEEQHLKWLEEMIDVLALRDGCKLVVVDPWNELEHAPMPGESMTAYINHATKKLRQIAERLDIHIALVAHPRKMPTDGKPRAPTGYDIADSAAFVNKPSLGVTVHQASARSEETGEDEEWVELHVWKVRKVRLYGFQRGVRYCRFVADRMSYVKRPYEAAS